MATKVELASAKGTDIPPPREPPGTPSYAEWAAAFQEPPGTPSYAEWAAAFQAYYGPGATAPYSGYFLAAAAGAASGQHPHSYAWGGHPLIGPYGNALQPVMHPYGGMYAHPTLNAGMVSYSPYGMLSPSTKLAMAAPTMEAGVKPAMANGHGTAKRSKESKGSSSVITAIGSDEATKGTSCSESGTEGSNESSEEERTLNGFQTTSKTCFEKSSMNGKHEAGNPTNLNIIGVDYWNASTPIRLKGKRASADVPTSLIPTLSRSLLIAQGQDGIDSDLWSQDDKELKRQRRKQSNRESARRSRLRKQVECGELSVRVDSLTAENVSLRAELDRLAEECTKLFAENAAIKKDIQTYDGENAEASQEQDESSEKQVMQLPEEANLSKTVGKPPMGDLSRLIPVIRSPALPGAPMEGRSP